MAHLASVGVMLAGNATFTVNVPAGTPVGSEATFIAIAQRGPGGADSPRWQWLQGTQAWWLELVPPSKEPAR